MVAGGWRCLIGWDSEALDDKDCAIVGCDRKQAIRSMLQSATSAAETGGTQQPAVAGAGCMLRAGGE